MVVLEHGVEWPDWIEHFRSRRVVLVARRKGEHDSAFADRALARLRSHPPRCAALLLSASDYPETLAARARIGRALALALGARGGVLTIGGAAHARADAAALAEVLATSAPANVRVVIALDGDSPPVLRAA